MMPAEMAVMQSHRSMYRYRHSPLSAKQEGAFFNGYVRDSCPFCGRTFTPMDGTIFQGHRLPVSERCEFLLQTFSVESMNSLMREECRPKTTLPYWMAKLF